MLTIHDVHKSFGAHPVLRGVSFEVKSGEVVGLLGLNGAGKTTLMRIMTGFLSADSGSVELDGISLSANPSAVKARIGYLPEQAPVYGEMRVQEFLEFIAEARGIPRDERSVAIDRVLESCRLSEMRWRLAGKLSKGYRHRLGLAQAVIHNPSLLILDEPTDGLDPVQKVEAREMIAELGRDRAVIVSTHIMEEVNVMCSRTVVLENGVIVSSEDVNWIG